MKSRALSGLCLCVAMLTAACGERRLVPATPGAPELVVLTYNVNFGLDGDPATVAAIRRSGADVVFLQETTPGWERELRALRAIYPRQAYRHDRGAGGLAVLSKLPFRQLEYLPSPAGWFAAWRVLVATPLGALQVLQVHLRPPVSDRGSWVSGYFTTGSFRRGEIDHFARSLRPGMPTLVVGDFNEGDAGKAVRYLADRGLRSVLADAGSADTTWRWQTSLGQISLRLDHICYSRELVPVRAQVLRDGRSDHLPVLAVFQTITR
jgi:endonuclease/exonuclease/phosphatase (EEP) superfamily protein YafD